MNLGSEKEISRSLNRLMEEVKGKAEQNVLEQVAIRTMSKAVYSADNIGHYGLAFDYYTHFTSPIRRYPDMMVHRLLEHYLYKGKPVDEQEIEMECKHLSQMEMRAAEAERASVKYTQVKFMRDKVGNSYEGIISGVTEWGLYVEMTETRCEGMIRLRDLNDDYYEFEETSYSIRGHRTGKRFQLGDVVNVTVKRVDIDKKQIDLLLEMEKMENEAPEINIFERGRRKGGDRSGGGGVTTQGNRSGNRSRRNRSGGEGRNAEKKVDKNGGKSKGKRGGR